MIRHDTRDDAGIALVTVLGMAILGTTIALVVVTMSIMVAQDSGRDRTRTIEVHAAEAALDATMAELEIASPCDAPSFSPATYSDGADETVVTVSIEYKDDAGNVVGCTAGALDGTPASAVVTATATATRDFTGLDPERTLVAQLALTPRTSVSNDAALYSSADLVLASGMDIAPQLSSENADVWIDEGHWDCGSGSYLTGSLIMPDGSLDFDSDCSVTGDIWVEYDFYLSGSNSSTGSAGGDVTVRSGDLEGRNHLYFGGDVTVGGSLDMANSKIVYSGGPQQYNVGADAITDIEPVGIPYIEYDFLDWQAMGFVEQDDEDLYDMLLDQWSIASNETWRSGPVSNCQYHGWIANGNSIEFPSVPTVYDLRECDNVKFNNGNTLELYADTALFMQDFHSTGNLTIVSGDGEPHSFWAIVPQPTGGYSAGDIESSTAITVDPAISTFWYSPNEVEVRSSSDIVGQIYGGTVKFTSGRSLIYTNVGVPGVSLVTAAQTDNGFIVELLAKQED